MVNGLPLVHYLMEETEMLQDMLGIRANKWGSTQLGIDIDGENSWRFFRNSYILIITDGGWIAIGGSGNDENGNSSGHVRIYEWSDPIWVQLWSRY
ncbi:MAG: hypothetical protein R2778_06070 [Saprospiraceae bacterium]